MKRFLASSLILLFCAAAAWGQSQATTGVIQGTVADPKGGGVPGASVEAKNLDTNLMRKLESDPAGRFSFLQLPPGRYTLTVVKQGFATIVQENLELSVGQAITLAVAMKISAVAEKVTVTGSPTVDVAQIQASTTLNPMTISTTPVLGRKFEDLLTLTPGVSIVQGPDGDEINFSGQRGIFNNISLDGGDYNNGFFGEQMGGQRAAVDITMEAVKEFQVVASGASPEFGRTAGGVVNVITKSGTNDVHGSLFHYQRLQGLTANTSDGMPLQDFRREQFGGTVGGPIIKDKLFFFGAFEQIFENLQRSNLSTPIGTPCSVSAPVVGTNDALIAGSSDCQRLALLNFYKTKFSTDESLPVTHTINNSAIFGRMDWNPTPKNNVALSYSFDYSKNVNQTFDVPTYGTSANGVEGPSKINVVNGNWFSTISPTQLNEFHLSYSRENRPREAVNTSAVPDTGIGFAPSFRFGQPFFLEPGVDEVFWRSDLNDKYTIVHGNHTIKFGAGWIHSVNTQVFRGFFTGRYLFSDVVGFLHYASPAALGPGYGPNAGACPNGTYTALTNKCSDGSAPSGPLLFYLQHAALSGPTTDAAGASSIANEDLHAFVQDSWKATRGLTFTFGLRWEGQVMPSPTLDPTKTAYGPNLTDPRFPSDGTIHNQMKMFQPRAGFAWDPTGKGSSVIRGSLGIYNARQNMLTQVGAITTNGVQQQSIFEASGIPGAPIYPNVVVPPAIPAGTLPLGAGVTVFSKDYANPRIYTANIAAEHEWMPNFATYAEFTWSKGVHLTRFIDPNYGGGPAFGGTGPFLNLGSITDTVSSSKSLYQGVTLGIRKRMSKHFQLDANYTLSVDRDDDSNERDPFTFRYFDLHHLNYEYSYSDRDERHKFNFAMLWDMPKGFQLSVRQQAHSAQPISPAVRTGADRNSLRKDNQFYSMDWRLERPIAIHERFHLIPTMEMFNTFNNANNVNPLTSPLLFDFNGFLREGVGDPREVQLSLKLTF
jgi:hypothetical protein